MKLFHIDKQVYHTHCPLPPEPLHFHDPLATGSVGWKWTIYIFGRRVKQFGYLVRFK